MSALHMTTGVIYLTLFLRLEQYDGVYLQSEIKVKKTPLGMSCKISNPMVREDISNKPLTTVDNEKLYNDFKTHVVITILRQLDVVESLSKRDRDEIVVQVITAIGNSGVPDNKLLEQVLETPYLLEDTEIHKGSITYKIGKKKRVNPFRR